MILLYKFFFSLIIFFYSECLSTPVEYLYPIAYNPLQNALYLMYQKSPDSIELWFWNPETKQAIPALLSRFTPAGVRILPSGKGFSFIDHGVIKVQSLLKRSPARIELDWPLHDITMIEWITDDICYLSAKERSHYGIYQINREGQVSRVAVKPNVDCLYPQKVDSQLFYVERQRIDDFQQHKIIQIEYKAEAHPVEVDFEEFSNQDRDVKEKGNSQKFNIIQSFDINNAIAFLHMVSLDYGYFVSHPIKIKRTDVMVNCEYNALSKQKTGEWSVLRLFCFAIPASLLFVNSETRLYESILPLLPKQYGNHIYYNDINSDNLSIYSYNIVTGKNSRELYSSVVGQHYFVPILIGNTLYSGGRLFFGLNTEAMESHNINNNGIPLLSLSMEANDSGVMVQLPTIQI